MARRFTKGIDLVEAQKKRFAAMEMTARQGHKDLAEQGLSDAKELTAGTLTPSQTRGAFARGASPAASTPTGRQRALTKRQQKNRGLKRAFLPALPVNQQSHRLHDSMELVSTNHGIQSFDLTQNNPGGGIFRIVPGGTKKLIASGFHAEVKRRWKARNAAFVQFFIRKQRQ